MENAMNKKEKVVGNYITRENMAEEIIKKLSACKDFTEEEKAMIQQAVEDPLEEFCQREATFRLVEILDIEPERANQLEDLAQQEIRDDIDYADSLYDTIDDDLREMYVKCSKSYEIEEWERRNENA